MKGTKIIREKGRRGKVTRESGITKKKREKRRQEAKKGREG